MEPDEPEQDPADSYVGSLGSEELSEGDEGDDWEAVARPAAQRSLELTLDAPSGENNSLVLCFKYAFNLSLPAI